MFIYMTTNLVTGKSYIGLCTRDDINYLGSGVRLKQAIKKYGKHNFKRTILEECDNFNTLCEREIYWIQKYNAVESDNFYNLSYGGSGGDPILMKRYWDTIPEEKRKHHRNWKPYFLGLDQRGSKHISKMDPTWSIKVSKAVKDTWDSYTTEERKARVHKMKKMQQRDKSGLKNPMYGRSAVREKNLKWYTDGTNNLYITENTQPDGYRRGRTMKRKEVVADYGKV